MSIISHLMNVFPSSISLKIHGLSLIPSLKQSVLYARAVSHEHYIFIIGGRYHQQVLNTVQIIDIYKQWNDPLISSDIFIHYYASDCFCTLLYERMTDAIHLIGSKSRWRFYCDTNDKSISIPHSGSVPSVSDAGDTEEEEQAI
eukprot:423380_1